MGENAITLGISANSTVSNLKALVYEEELNQLNEKYPLKDNELDVKGIYFNKKEAGLEVGFFIRSTVPAKIALESINLVVKNQNNEVVAVKYFDFKSYGPIEPFTGVPFEALFQISEGVSLKDEEEYHVEFGQVAGLKGYSSLEAEIENMPEGLPYEEERGILDYYKNLPNLQVDTVSFHSYKFFYDEEGGIHCIIIIRNGYNQTVKLEKFPIAIFNEDEFVVARTVFSNDEGLVEISPRKAQIIKFHFEPYEILPGNPDLSKCRIAFK